MLGVGVEARVALGEEVDDGQAVRREDVGSRIEDGRSRGLDGAVHRAEHPVQIGDSLQIAIEIAREEMFASEMMKRVIGEGMERHAQDNQYHPFHDLSPVKSKKCTRL